MSSNFILWEIGLPWWQNDISKNFKRKIKGKKILLLDGDDIRKTICSLI